MQPVGASCSVCFQRWFVSAKLLYRKYRYMYMHVHVQKLETNTNFEKQTSDS